MYIYMNKEQNRVLCKNSSYLALFSGDLSVTQFPVNFKPSLAEGNLWEKFCNLFSDMKMVKVDMDQTFTRNYFQHTGLFYTWLFHVDSGKVYRVWDGHPSNPSNCSKLLKEGVVMIKGVGNFKCESF